MHTIHVLRELCTGCGTCVKACPYLCFELVERTGESNHNIGLSKKLSQPVTTENPECVACRSCQVRCPDFAISIIEG